MALLLLAVPAQAVPGPAWPGHRREEGVPLQLDPVAVLGRELRGDGWRTYLRSELEHLWVKKSGGTAYLVYPTGHAVPPIPTPP